MRHVAGAIYSLDLSHSPNTTLRMSNADSETTVCHLERFLREDANGQTFGESSVLVSSRDACKTKLEKLYKKLDAAANTRLNRALWPLNEKEHRQSVQDLRAIAQCIYFAITIDQR